MKAARDLPVAPLLKARVTSVAFTTALNYGVTPNGY
jgi:hypothetical protein